MRKNRVIEQNRCYHLVSRLAHRAFFLDDEEKDRAVALMRRVEAGVKASMSYCINRTVSISSDPFDPLARYGKGDNGYYDVWELWRKVYIDGTADGGEWATLYAAKREAVRKSIYVCGTEQDKEGKWRWMSTLRPCEGGIAASGLGDNADIALAVLQLTWPISNRCPPKNGWKAAPDTGVTVDI